MKISYFSPDKEYPIYFISLEQLIKNKESVNRDKDKQDLKFLNKVRNRKNG
jgi:hypothetical protein